MVDAPQRSLVRTEHPYFDAETIAHVRSRIMRDLNSCPAYYEMPASRDFFIEQRMQGLLEADIYSYASEPLQSGFVGVFGAFDGLHKGHWTLIDHARKKASASALELAVICFSPDPSYVLARDRKPHILSLDDRIRALLSAGVDRVIVLHFTSELAALTGYDFAQAFCAVCPEMSAVCVGSDFRYGYKAQATPFDLRYDLAHTDIEVEMVELASSEEGLYKSTAIRTNLAEGDLLRAANALGRVHAVQGIVTHGKGLGNTLGFPTANILVDALMCLPSQGVFAGLVIVDNLAYAAACNLGRPLSRDLFEEHTECLSDMQLIEATLLNFEGNLYERDVRVALLQKLRDAQVFATLDELKEMVQTNIVQTRELLGIQPYKVGVVSLAPETMEATRRYVLGGL